MKINKDTLFPYLLYSLPYPYNEQITLYPVKMNNIIDFMSCSHSITIRKNSRFPDKSIIKMNYLEFLIHTATHPELDDYYNYPNLSKSYFMMLMLLDMVCSNQEIIYLKTGEFYINGCEITPDILDDLRRIIILQNDIDFDIDEFLNYDTEQRLNKAKNDTNKKNDKVTIEDYIDSLSVALHITEEQIAEMSIRKFWRFIKRYNLFENYNIMRTGECSGMIKFKEPIKHWMTSIDDGDRYESLKTDEQALRDKL